MDETFNQAFLEYLLSDAALSDAMDAYGDCAISSDQFKESVQWRQDALERYEYVGATLFVPELWVL